jgi:phospholipid-binding lipoprotein MlaA
VESAPTPAPTPPSAALARDPSDPWERTNRKIYKFNENLDRRVIRPVAKGYDHTFPRTLRDGIRHFFNNLGEPVTAINDLLQFRVKDAAITTIRFAANSTLGFLGFVDFARNNGLEGHVNGFANTLGRHHVGPGPYMVLPVLGPSTVRDTVGTGVDIVMNPLTFVRFANRATVATSAGVVNGVDTRARAEDALNALNSTATDPYATLRSVYLQNRQAEIRGQIGGKEPLPEFDELEPVKPPDASADSTATELADHTAKLSQTLAAPS